MIKSVHPEEYGTISLPCGCPHHDKDLKDRNHNNDHNGNNSQNLSDRNTENLDRNKMADDNKCTDSTTRMTATHSSMTLKL